MHHIPPAGDKHVYYLLFKLAAIVNSIAENNTSIGIFRINTVNGKNSYSPICTQGPGAKIYVLTIYALSSEPIIAVAPNKITMDIITEALKSSTLAKTALFLTYSWP